jgi:hypothetical protein
MNSFITPSEKKGSTKTNPQSKAVLPRRATLSSSDIAALENELAAISRITSRIMKRVARTNIQISDEKELLSRFHKLCDKVKVKKEVIDLT